MRHSKLLLLVTLLAVFLTGYSMTDQVEKPQVYTFIYSNGDTALLKNPTDSVLRLINDDIASHRKSLTEAYVIFKHGEKIIFKYQNSKLAAITLNTKVKQISIPKFTVNRISDVHFQSVTVLWDGREKNPFNTNYFYIRFHVGTVKSFERYPYVELRFQDNEYLKTIIWKQVSEHKLQFSDL